MKIEGIEIGEAQPVFIIAEAGINAGDNLNFAKQLVDIAVHSGADAVKFQTFKPSEISKSYLKNITYEETTEIKKYCDQHEIIFLSTPHSISAIDFLYPLVPAYKIASPYITNQYFVKRIRVKGKPIIASTGSISNLNRQATDNEIRTFLNLITEREKLALLYCVSSYPCPAFSEKSFMGFRSGYSGFPIGYSSHSKDINHSIQAVLSGASIIEQHITLDDNFECPDKNVSLNPDELDSLVDQIRVIDDEKGVL